MIALTEIAFDNWRRFRMLPPEEWQQWLGNKQVVPPIYDREVDTPSVVFLKTWVDE